MDIFIPSGISFTQAASQVTHLGIGAHQDDLEIMAFHGISECYHHGNKHFAGITCTNGSGSPRQGAYASYSDDEIRRCRHEEQCRAASLGEYLFIAQLDFSSAALQDSESVFKIATADHEQAYDLTGVRRADGRRQLEERVSQPAGASCIAAGVDFEKNSSTDPHLANVLYEILQQLNPQIIYTHHPFDKHPTHRAVYRAVMEALRRLPTIQQPKKLFGGEVWRSLDWVTDDDKICLDVSANPELLEKLISVFDSQLSGGKRYDLATLGRYRANATYATPYTTDQALLIAHAIDLMPLLHNTQLTLQEFALGFVDRFRKQIIKELS
jgi:LmbE family N-acetylglucosaminyl deacetylase